MSDVDHEHNECRILDLANQPVVAHPVAPEAHEGGSVQHLALAPRKGVLADATARAHAPGPIANSVPPLRAVDDDEPGESAL